MKIAKKRRRKGKSTMEVEAKVDQGIPIGRPGITFVATDRWKRSRPRILGTLVVSTGGLRWRPGNAKKEIRRSWNMVATWFDKRADT